MQQGYQKPQAFFTIFRCWDRDWTYLSKKRDFRKARKLFRNDCLPITSIKPWNRMEKGGITLQHSKQVFELTKTSYPSDQVSDYNESWSCKNWRPSSLFSLYVRMNILIASHFTQVTRRESQTPYPSLTAKLFSCLIGFLQIFLPRKTLAFTQHFRLSQNLFKTGDGLLSKLINGVGNARIEMFTDMRGKKERNVEYLLVTRLTTECVINLGFVGLLPGLVLFFCHMQSYLFKEDV